MNIPSKSVKVEIKPVVWKKDSSGKFLLDSNGKKIVDKVGNEVTKTEDYSFVAVITKVESQEVTNPIHVELEDVKNTEIVIGAPGHGTTSGSTGATSSPPIVLPPQPPPPSVVLDDNNWTVVKPANDSRLIYVAQSGNDDQAALVKGRGYYLPSDPEIGPDPTNPVGPIVAYATHFEAAKRLRLSNCTGTAANGFPLYSNNNPQPSTVTGFPDWILLKRGGSYTTNPSLAHPNSGVTETYNLGMLLGGHQQPSIGWNQSENRLVYWAGPWRGRSASEPSVVTAWGPLTDPRPIVNGFTISGGARHVVVSSLDLNGTDISWGWSGDGFEAGPAILEDVSARSWGANNLSSWSGGIIIRRCVASGTFNPNSHNQGFFCSGKHVVVMEECVIDRNGYKENPNEPTKWTAKLSSALTIGELPVGTGVQPTRTWFDRNLYLSSYDSMSLRGCVISRGGGGSSVQMREGGICERNLFIWCQQSLGIPHPESNTSRVKSSIVKQNLILHDDHMLPPGGWGTGFGVGGGSDDSVIVDDNIVAHFHRGTNGGESLMISGKSSSGTDPAKAASPLQKCVMVNNDIFHQFGAGGIIMERSTSQAYGYTVDNAKVVNNKVSVNRLLSGQGDGSRPKMFFYSGNKYHSTGATTNHFIKQWTGADYRFFPTNTDLNGWKSSGFDLDVESVESDFSRFKTSAGWTNPERDIVSYMGSIDPTYVPNEEIYVDDDCSGEKQASRRKVWEVMTTNGLSEPQSRLIARRYHAFVTFINRAKANRKGAWDSRYTAEAVNNYMREGFGKPRITGPYATKMSDVQNY